jgi:hypothetical protein
LYRLGQLVLESGDRRENLSAVPHGQNADFLEVFGRQIRENFTVNGVLPECVLVLAESGCSEPRTNIHVRFPSRNESESRFSHKDGFASRQLDAGDDPLA